MIMKHKNLLMGTLLLTAISLLFSCQPKAGSKPFGNMTFDSIQINRTDHLVTSDTTSPACNLIINYVYPVQCDSTSIKDSVLQAVTTAAFGRDYKNKTATEAVDSYQQNYVENYRNDLMASYLESKDDSEEQEQWFSYYEQIEARPLLDNPLYLIYELKTSEYRGGAHGMYATHYLNFDPATGHLMNLHDLFYDGFEPTINKLLLNKLMKMYDCTTQEELEEAGLLMGTDIYPSQNFSLNTGNITFIYNVYEIAPYSMGEIEISITYEELADWLKIKH